MIPKAEVPYDWLEDCMKWRGRPLTGNYVHWCLDWDLLPIDETCPEFPCVCFPELKKDKE